MKKYTLLLFLLFAGAAFSQDDAYLRETKNLLKQVISNKPHKLLDKPLNLVVSYCDNDFLTDSLSFSRDELKFIKESLAKSPIKKWSIDLDPKAQILDAEEVLTIFKEEKQAGWTTFNEEYGKGGFDQYAAPLFLRDYTYCLFYFSHACGGLCGYGELALYVKENGQWRFVKSYCSWMS